MKKKVLRDLCLCVSAFIPAAVFASVNDTIKTQTIDDVLILGNYKQEVILENPLLEPASLKSSVSKINQVDIVRQGATTLVEALKYTPGAWIETRGRKVKQLFSVRGQAYPYPSYTINGIWQKEFQEMSYFINSANIEEVSINRSSSALLNSLSALTGVVNVKTIRPTSREMRFFGKYGSLNSYQTGLSYSDATEKVAYTAVVNGTGTDGIKHMNGQESMWNAMGSFDWKISDRWSWAMNAFYVIGKRELALPVAPADSKFLTKKEEYSPYKALMIASRLRYKATDRFTSELQLNYAGRKPSYKSTNIKTDKVTEYKETDHEFTTNWINALAINPDNTLRLGLLYNYWIAPEGKRFYYGKKGKVHTMSAVVTDQHSFGNLSVDAGFRITRQYFANWGGFNIEGGGGKFSKVTPIVDEWQSPEWQATAGLTYSFTDRSALYFSYAGGVVTPRKGALNDDGVKPDNETRMNFDLGYSFMFTPGSKLSVTAFMVNRANAIAYSGKTIENKEGDIMELYQNRDMRNYGIEAAYQSPRFVDLFSFFTNATLMIGQENVKDDWKKDDELPCFIANFGTSFGRGAWDANAFLNYVGPYKNDRFVSKDYLKEFGKAPLGDFITMDVTAGYRIGKAKNIRLFVEAKNLFDNCYQTVPGYEDYGITVSGGIDIRL